MKIFNCNFVSRKRKNDKCTVNDHSDCFTNKNKNNNSRYLENFIEVLSKSYLGLWLSAADKNILSLKWRNGFLLVFPLHLVELLTQVRHVSSKVGQLENRKHADRGWLKLNQLQSVVFEQSTWHSSGEDKGVWNDSNLSLTGF